MVRAMMMMNKVPTKKWLVKMREMIAKGADMEMVIEEFTLPDTFEGV